MNRSIKFSAMFLGLMILTMGAVAHADPMDPKIIIGDPTNCNGVEGNCEITEDSFFFTVNGDTPSDSPLGFGNDTGHSWTQLLLTWAPPPSFSDVTVEFGNGFGGWDFISLDGAVLNNKYGIDPNQNGVLLFCSGDCSSITNGEDFTLAFVPGDDGGVWPDPTNINGDGNPTKAPEPGFGALLLSTVGLLASRRKLWKSLTPTFSSNIC